MRKYLSTLHERPESHKKRFALFTSSLLTLFIFGFWALANFGVQGDSAVIAESDTAEVSPFESLRSSVASSFEALRGNFGELKAGLETVNIEGEYEEMKDSALIIYGQ